MAKKTETLVAYKGFDKDLSCRGFKYEIGKTYEHEGHLSLCQSGFHACEAPLDIWGYYPPTDGNQAAQVELSGATDEKSEDTKRVGRSITIKAALSIPALIAAQIEWTFNEAKKSEKVKGDGKAVASSGYNSKAASSGDSSTAASSGDSSTAACDTNGFACVAGLAGYVKGKDGSALSLGYRDSQGRNRIAVGYVGENGIKADTWYRANANGELVAA